MLYYQNTETIDACLWLFSLSTSNHTYPVHQPFQPLLLTTFGKQTASKTQIRISPPVKHF